MASFQSLLDRMMGAPGAAAADDAPPVLSSPDLAGFAAYVKAKDCRRIVVMAGAGISTSAGIPDFRSPGTGLYDNLQKYNLPHPTAVFELDYFRENPRPFYFLAKELYPGNFSPTPAHMFLRLLQDEGRLQRVYTQNIDTLERRAGIKPDLLVEAHGSFADAHCIACKHPHEHDWVKEHVFAEKIPKCTICDGLVKPDIVFFGENLPERFGRLCSRDMKACDALIIIGTSLTVQPFASLVDMVGASVPRLLINRDRVGESVFSGGLDFDSKRRDVHVGGTCDDGCRELAEALNLGPAFAALLADESSLASASSEATSAVAGGSATEGGAAEDAVADAAEALAAVTLDAKAEDADKATAASTPQHHA